MREYRLLLQRHPDVIDLVDKTSVEELLQVILAMRAVVTCESGPLHMALGLQVPVVALFVNRGSFSLTPEMRGPGFVCLDAFEPCFKYNWRWKFFCNACRDQHYRMYGCNLKSFPAKQDLLPVKRVVEAVEALLGERPGAQPQRCEAQP